MKNDAPVTNQSNTYSTGAVTPKKSHRNLIAVLLILVLLLGSTVSVLGMMNIRLFRMLESERSNTQPAPVNFSRTQTQNSYSTEEAVLLGIEGAEVDVFYRNYYKWPEGIYISDVFDGSAAQLAGICCGDILTAGNGKTVGKLEHLIEFLNSRIPGTPFELTIYRDGDIVKIVVMVD